MKLFTFLFKLFSKTDKNFKKDSISKYNDEPKMSENIEVEKTSLNDLVCNISEPELGSSIIEHQSTFNHNKKTTEAIIGFDFGSSCSKVVVNFPTFDKKIAIDFECLGHESNSYLLPTIIYLDDNGNFSIEKANNKMFKDFKTKLINNSHQICHEKFQIKYIDLAIAYIALVLKIVKSKILSSNEIPSNNISWQFNLGIPSASHNDKALRVIFKNLACSAWVISESSSNVNYSILKFAKNEDNWKYIKTSHLEKINIVSEIAAEVVGFAQSSDRRNGLYVLIDIGSRTIDISSFNLHQLEESDKFSFLTAEVGELGTFYLHDERLKLKNNSILKNYYKSVSNLTINDSVAPLPNFIEYFEKNSGLKEIDEIKLLNDFYINCRKFLTKTFVDLRRKRYPKAPEWESGLPIFICGGGKNINFYNLILDSIEKEYIIGQVKSKLIKNKLPVNEKLNYRFNDTDRIAVAYGLSFGIYDIGEIRPPEDFADIIYTSKNELENSEKIVLNDADYL